MRACNCDPGEQEMTGTRGTATAQVILRSRKGGALLPEEPVTAANVGKIKVEDEVIREATSKLSALGFAIGSVGVNSVSISGDPALFESAFHTRLQRRSTPTGASGGPSFEAVGPLKVPDD